LDIVLAVHVSWTVRPLTVAVGALPAFTVVADAPPDPIATEIQVASATDAVVTSDPNRKAKRNRRFTA
jgi:hypothetical protein